MSDRGSESDSDSLPSTEPCSPRPAVGAQSSVASNGHGTSVAGFKPKNDEFLMIYEKIEWLRNRQKNLNVCINSDKFRSDISKVNIDELMDLITNLQITHCDEVSTAALHELSVTRLQLANMLHHIVEGNEEHDLFTDDMPELRDQILEMLMEMTELSTKGIKEQEDVTNLKKEVLKMELELSELTAERSHQTKSITERNELQKKLRENVSSKKIEKLEKKVEHQSKLICTINQIIQSIISGSTMNWAKFSDIKELLLSVSKPMDIQLKECLDVEDAA